MTTPSVNSLSHLNPYSVLPLLLPVVSMTPRAFHTELKSPTFETRSAFAEPDDDGGFSPGDYADNDEEEDDDDEDDEDDEEDDEPSYLHYDEDYPDDDEDDD